MEVIYQGNARIYLQGKRALLPYGSLKKDELKCYIGSKNTRLRIKDFRREPIEAARKIISGENGISFTEFFNKPAQVTVSKNPRGVDIELHESTDEPQFPILWLGVIHNGKMPVQKIRWEILKPVDENSTAFAAIVED